MQNMQLMLECQLQLFGDNGHTEFSPICFGEGFFKIALVGGFAVALNGAMYLRGQFEAGS